jgi:hypothetical protein
MNRNTPHQTDPNLKGKLGQLTESLLQGECLPILERRCPGAQNSTDL